MSIIGSNIIAGASGQAGYNLNNSLRFRSSASAYLSKTYSSSGTIDTWSFWIKRGKLGSAQTIFGTSNGVNQSFGIEFTSSDTIQVYDYLNAYRLQLYTTQVFRDPSAWYHIVLAIDTTQATAANRAKFYVNGTQVTAFSTATYPSINQSLNIGSVLNLGIGITGNVGGQLYDGYMTEWNFIDGQALTPSSFGETDTITGSWKPKAYTGTFGTNGFYLKFSDIATTSGSNAGLGKDFSGNANYWTTNNISVTAGTTYDAMIDSPTLTSATVANYCTLNPLPYYGGYSVLSRGNLQFTSGNTNWMRALATFAVSSGKWYWEVTVNNTQSQMHGITHATQLTYSAGATNWVGYDATGYAYFSDDGTKYNSNSGVAYGATYVANDIIGIAFDADNGKLFFSKNGTFQASGDPAAGTNAAFTGLTSGPYVPAVSLSTFSGANTCDANFGQRPFTYTPPTGFVRLNTFNLPDSTIKKGNTVMDATLYTGTATGIGANTITITNAAGFKPDFVWAKGRSIAYANGLFNSVCGVNKFLVSNSTNAELVNEVDGYLTSFNSNGFTLGNGSNSNLTFNSSPQTYVAWQWQAGQGTTSSNTSGSITSTVSASTTAGFSIVTYTGTGSAATVGHGLGVKPSMLIVKRRDSAANWYVAQTTLGQFEYLLLNSTAAKGTNGNIYFNGGLPDATSTVFQLGSDTGTNANTGTYVAYCWAEIAGFSKFTSYTGNGSADGPFIFCNFRPKWLLIKQTDVSRNWILVDSSRNTFNIVNLPLIPNDAGAEYTSTTTVFDFLSNGFKIRSNHVEANGSGNTYIVAAFAESPFKNSNAR